MTFDELEKACAPYLIRLDKQDIANEWHATGIGGHHGFHLSRKGPTIRAAMENMLGAVSSARAVARCTDILEERIDEESK